MVARKVAASVPVLQRRPTPDTGGAPRPSPAELGLLIAASHEVGLRHEAQEDAVGRIRKVVAALCASRHGQIVVS